MDTPVKLHLGCGSRILPGWVNVDMLSGPGVDVVCDAARLAPFEDGCASVVYACHVLEHVAQQDVSDTLANWFRVLRPGGLLRVAVPDFAALVRIYLDTGDVRALWGPLVGRGGLLAHHSLWDEAALQLALGETGFVNVRRYDWRETEHASVDDCSQAYIPHMDKERGVLVSLNMEAARP